MPTVTGSLRDIVGKTMEGRQGELIFTLNGPNVFVLGLSAGRIVPTEPYVITFDSTGEFSVNLAQTTAMLDDAYYTLKIRWLGADAPAAMMDFPDWQIRVDKQNGPIQNVIHGPGGSMGGSNGRIIWVSLTAPPKGRRGQYWLLQNPNNPESADSTCQLFEWR